MPGERIKKVLIAGRWTGVIVYKTTLNIWAGAVVKNRFGSEMIKKRKKEKEREKEKRKKE